MIRGPIRPPGGEKIRKPGAAVGAGMGRRIGRRGALPESVSGIKEIVRGTYCAPDDLFGMIERA